LARKGCQHKGPKRPENRLGKSLIPIENILFDHGVLDYRGCQMTGLVDQKLAELLTEMDFARHLNVHMDLGTRPTVMPGSIGPQAWTESTLSVALKGERPLDESTIQRSLLNWLDGKGCDGEWGLALERVFFGASKDSNHWKDWTLQFRTARRHSFSARHRRIFASREGVAKSLAEVRNLLTTRLPKGKPLRITILGLLAFAFLGPALFYFFAGKTRVASEKTAPIVTPAAIPPPEDRSFFDRFDLRLKADGSIQVSGYVSDHRLSPPMSRKDVIENLKRITGANERVSITLLGEDAVPFGDVKAVLFDLKDAGFSNVAICYRDRKCDAE
jgi:biopolymer transport protein ExbD